MSSLAPEQNRPRNSGPGSGLQYDEKLEESVAAVAERLSDSYRMTRRAIALLLLQNDREIEELARRTEGDRWPVLAETLETERARHGEPLDTSIILQRRNAVLAMTGAVVQRPETARVRFGERLSRLCTSPITGLPILALVVWFGLYQFVGIFGGKTLVDLLENGLFGAHLNPWMTAHFEHWIPWRWLSSLFVREYGVWTLGVTYAVALIFPIVGTFFLAFSCWRTPAICHGSPC